MPEMLRIRTQEGRIGVRGEESLTLATRTMALGSRQVSRVAYATDNKENILPAWAVAARRRVKLRRSPLPQWYPRTPLRDITVLVNALDRKRRARAVGVLQGDGGLEVTPEAQVLRGNEQQQLDFDHTPPSQVIAPDISGSSGSSIDGFSTPLSKHEQQDCAPALEHSSPKVLSSSDLPPSEYEKKLERSIDKIEKVVMNHLTNSAQAPVRKSTRVLMSMR